MDDPPQDDPPQAEFTLPSSLVARPQLPVPTNRSPRQNSPIAKVSAVETQAEFLANGAMPAYLAEASFSTFSSLVQTEAYKTYRDKLIRDAGARDPIEIMLIEQLALAHHHLGRLQIAATKAQSVEAIRILNAAAARLMGEFRRTALALRQYRSPVAKKAVTFVKQQNLAVGDQKIALVDNQKSSEKVSLPPDSKKSSNAEALTFNDDPISIEQESAAGRCRQAEPAQTKGSDAGRA